MLKFGNDGETHKTVIGGYFTILFFMAILAFIGFRASVMINREQ
jgi:hypothetical protein